MSHEQDIFNALKGLVNNRCYPDTFPQEPVVPVWPAIRYTQIGGLIFEDACGSGEEETDSTEFQIDIVAKTASERATLKNQARHAINAMATPTSLSIAPIQEYDPETKTYRAILRVTVHGSSS